MDETIKTPNVQDAPLSAPAQEEKAPEAAQGCCGCAQQDGQTGCGGCHGKILDIISQIMMNK